MTNEPTPPNAPSTDWTNWPEIDALFEQALDLPSNERETFVANSSATDATKATVLELLNATSESSTLSSLVWQGSALVLEALDPLHEHETIGHWRIVKPLGRGGMGTVYLAERTDGAVAQQVALKVLRRGLDTDDVLRRFRDERRILAALRHPHVARLIDGGATPDGRPWLAMEYIDGVNADAWCERTNATTQQRVALVRPVARAVHDAHRHLIVHRDIKPSNVLVTEDGVPKLLDFGIAKMLGDEQSDDSLTRTGMLMLTPGYAAPEQERGEQVATATDVYQLGVLLKQFVTGTKPDTGRTTSSATSATSAAATDATTVIQSAPNTGVALRGDLARIVAKAVHEDAARRYGTAGALADDLDNWLTGRPVSARPDTVLYRTTKFAQRHRWLAPAALLTLVLGGGWIASMVRNANVVAAERDMAQQQAARAEEVLSFVVNMFRSPDPGAERGSAGLPASITVVEVMEQGAQRVRSELAQFPDVQAELLGTIADVLVAVEHQTSADTLARDALALTARAHGDTSVQYAHALVRLGKSQAAIGNVREAEQNFRDAMAHRLANTGRYDVEAALAMFHLGSLLKDESKLSEAVVLLRSADSIFSYAASANGGDVKHITDRLANIASLGNVLTTMDSLPAAMQTYQRARVVAEQWVGPMHPQVGVSEVNLGKALSAMGAHDSAVQHFNVGLEVLRKTLGPSATTTLAANNNLANAYAAAGNFDAAANAYRETIQLRREKNGDVPHVETAGNIQNLAVNEAQRGDTAAAIRYHREAAQMYRVLGTDGPIPAFPQLSLAGLLLARGQLAEAEQVLASARARLVQFLPAGHYAIAVADCRLAESRKLRVRRDETVAAMRLALTRLDGGQAGRYKQECEAALARM